MVWPGISPGPWEQPIQAPAMLRALRCLCDGLRLFMGTYSAGKSVSGRVNPNPLGRKGSITWPRGATENRSSLFLAKSHLYCVTWQSMFPSNERPACRKRPAFVRPHKLVAYTGPDRKAVDASGQRSQTLCSRAKAIPPDVRERPRLRNVHLHIFGLAGHIPRPWEQPKQAPASLWTLRRLCDGLRLFIGTCAEGTSVSGRVNLNPLGRNGSIT